MNVRVREFGLADYLTVWRAMQAFTSARAEDSADELWCVEHPPVFTLGRAGRAEHVLAPGSIEVVRSDRGGQVTYHGPGQLVVYTLLNVRRLGIGPRDLVRRLEAAVIAYLAAVGIAGRRREGAPGVYVGDAKVAALGLRIRGSHTYHGLALNVAMDLEPFTRINPCGYADLAVTQLADLGGPTDTRQVREEFLPLLAVALYGVPAPALDRVRSDATAAAVV